MSVEDNAATGKVDHVAAALARLPQQFKGKTKIINLLTALATPAVSLEDALFQLLVERGVDDAVGSQLDRLGVIVGQERGGLVDADYRRYIRARIAANNSRGNFEDLIKVAALVLNDDTITIEGETQNGTVVVRLRAALTTDALAGITLSFLQDAVSAGIRVVLESWLTAESDTFSTALAVFTSAGITPGATQVQVVSAGWPDAEILKFPETGQVIIDQGLAAQETLTYTFRGLEAGVAKFKFGACANTHSSGASMTLTGAVATGAGLGNSADANQPTLTPYGTTGTTGGRMADARD